MSNKVSNNEKIDLLFKQFLNVSNIATDDNTKHYSEEPNTSFKSIFTNKQLYSQEIPNTAPTLEPIDGDKDGVISGNIVKYKKLPMSVVSLSENKSYTILQNDTSANILRNTIPFNYDAAGSYDYLFQYKSSDNIYTTITPTDGGWVLDPSSGILTFYGNDVPTVLSEIGVKLHQELVGNLYLTYYRYVGNIGLNAEHDTSGNVLINNGNLGIGTTDASGLLDVSGTHRQVIVDLSGNLGIGKMPDPDYTLDVSGNINIDGGNLFKDGSLFQSSYWEKTDNNIYYNSGNVSIGKAPTAYKLDVSGNVNIEGNLNIVGTTTTIDASNVLIEDTIIELARTRDASSGLNNYDSGIVIRRGAIDASNAFIGFSENDNKFVMGTGDISGASTGNLTINPGTLKVSKLEIDCSGLANLDISGSITIDTSNNLIYNTINSHIFRNNLVVSGDISGHNFNIHRADISGGLFADTGNIAGTLDTSGLNVSNNLVVSGDISGHNFNIHRVDISGGLFADTGNIAGTLDTSGLNVSNNLVVSGDISGHNFNIHRVDISGGLFADTGSIAGTLDTSGLNVSNNLVVSGDISGHNFNIHRADISGGLFADTGSIAGTLNVLGTTTLQKTDISGHLDASGVTITDKLDVSGNTLLRSQVDISGGLFTNTVILLVHLMY